MPLLFAWKPCTEHHRRRRRTGAIRRRDVPAGDAHTVVGDDGVAGPGALVGAGRQVDVHGSAGGVVGLVVVDRLVRPAELDIGGPAVGGRRGLDQLSRHLVSGVDDVAGQADQRDHENQHRHSATVHHSRVPSGPDHAALLDPGRIRRKRPLTGT